jgi:hypothetical protein
MTFRMVVPVPKDQEDDVRSKLDDVVDALAQEMKEEVVGIPGSSFEVLACEIAEE